MVSMTASGETTQKEPSSVIECERETVPVRSGASWRGIKQREGERAGEREQLGESQQAEMWTCGPQPLLI